MLYIRLAASDFSALPLFSGSAIRKPPAHQIELKCNRSNTHSLDIGEGRSRERAASEAQLCGANPVRHLIFDAMDRTAGWNSPGRTQARIVGSRKSFSCLPLSFSILTG
jgi:hypothetical protein